MYVFPSIYFKSALNAFRWERNYYHKIIIFLNEVDKNNVRRLKYAIEYCKNKK